MSARADRPAAPRRDPAAGARPPARRSENTPAPTPASIAAPRTVTSARPTAERQAQRVGLDLKERLVVREAAVHAQAVHRADLGHRLDDVNDTPGDRLERRARDVCGDRRPDAAPRSRRGPPAATRARPAPPAPAARSHRRCRGTSRGRGTSAAASAARPRPSASQSSSEPAANTPPSSAWATSPTPPPRVGRRPGDRRQQAAPARTAPSRASQHEHARCRMSPSARPAAPHRSRPAPPAGRRAERRQRDRGRPAAVARARPARRTSGRPLEATAALQPEHRQQLLVPVAPAGREQLRARRRREVCGEAPAEAVASGRRRPCPGAACPHPAPGARRRRCRAATPACRPRSTDRAAGPSARSAPERRRRAARDLGEKGFLALVLPHDHGRQRATAARVPGEDGLALVIEARGEDLAAGRPARAPPRPRPRRPRGSAPDPARPSPAVGA